MATDQITSLSEQVEALLAMNRDGACIPKVPNLAVTLLEAQSARIRDLERENERLQGFATWASSGDTGLSSEFIARHMLGVKPPDGSYGCRHPLDVADFGRCHRLLEAVPAWKSRIVELSAYSPEWSALAMAWGDIADAYEDNDTAKVSELIRRARSALKGGE